MYRNGTWHRKVGLSYRGRTNPHNKSKRGMERRPSINELVVAIEDKHWSAVEQICGTKPELVNTKDKGGFTPLMMAVWEYFAPEDVVMLMLEKATKEIIQCTHPNSGRSSILHYLALRGYAKAVRRVLESTPRGVNLKDIGGRTPLHYCMDAWWLHYDQHRETAVCLMTYGASFTIKDKKGKTPLALYNANDCREYERNTRKQNKKKLVELLEEFAVPAEILARGEDAIRVFKDEIQHGEIAVVNSRIMFLGKEGVGKTSCAKAMLGKQFNVHERSTDGIVITTTVFQADGEDYSMWEEQNIDVQERSKQIHEDAIADKVVKRLKESQQRTLKSPPSDSTSSSKNELEEGTMTFDEKENLQASQKTEEDISTTMAIGSDVNELPEEIHKKVVDKLGDTSCRHNKRGLFGKIRQSIKRKKPVINAATRGVGPADITYIWDCAGQITYCITHRFFLTDGSSYSVVFSVLDDLDDLAKPRDSNKGQFEMTNLQMNLFWIRSIYENTVLRNGNAGKQRMIRGRIASPPICLVATHIDQLQGSEQEKRIKVEAMFNRLFAEIREKPYERHVDREMYMVDNTNTSDEGIKKLKKNVGGYLKGMKRTVPIRWVKFQSKVQEVGKTRLHVSLDEVTQIAGECGICKRGLSTALEYLNDTGIVLYSKTNEKLKNIVVTNLHMMIEKLTKIITVVKPDDIDKWPILMDLWNKLDTKGILEEKLLRHLWRCEEEDVSCFEVFLELMKKFGLLFEKLNEDNRVFMVPCRMKIQKEGLVVKKDDKQSVSIYVSPTDFLPDAVYNVLVVAFLDLMDVKGRSSDHLELFQNRSDFDLDDAHIVSLGLVKIQNSHALKLEISHRVKVDEHGIEEATEPHPSLCMEVLAYLRRQLETVYVTMEGVGYELRMLCDVCEPTSTPHLHTLEDCLSKGSVSCGRKSMETRRLNRLFSTGFDDKYRQETINFVTLQTLVIGCGTKQLRSYFLEKSKLKKPDVKQFLTNERQHGCLKDVDFRDQTDVFTSADNIDALNMNIMMTLIRYCYNTPKGEDFWENPPDDDKSELANLVRIYRYKQTVLDCSCNNRITDEEFEIRWKDLTAMFTGAGIPVEDVDNYRRQYKRGTTQCYNTTEEIRNFQAILSVTVDLGTEIIREYFLKLNKIQKKDVGIFLSNKTVKDNLKKVKLFPEQKKKLIDADIDKFDISLLMILIRNCCSIPASFWTNPTELTNLILIHQYRNNILAHTANGKLSNEDFEIEWKKVKSMLHGAGASLVDIDRYNTLRFMN